VDPGRRTRASPHHRDPGLTTPSTWLGGIGASPPAGCRSADRPVCPACAASRSAGAGWHPRSSRDFAFSLRPPARANASAPARSWPERLARRPRRMKLDSRRSSRNPRSAQVEGGAARGRPWKCLARLLADMQEQFDRCPLHDVVRLIQVVQLPDRGACRLDERGRLDTPPTLNAALCR